MYCVEYGSIWPNGALTTWSGRGLLLLWIVLGYENWALGYWIVTASIVSLWLGVGDVAVVVVGS